MQRFLIERDFSRPTRRPPPACVHLREAKHRTTRLLDESPAGQFKGKPDRPGLGARGAVGSRCTQNRPELPPGLLDWVQSAAVSAMAIRAAFSSTMA